MTGPSMPLLDMLARVGKGDFPRIERAKNIITKMKVQAQLSQALAEEQTVIAAEIIKQDYKKGDRGK